MGGFFSQQADYIQFFYGLSFVVMAMACFGMGRPSRSPLPWGILGLFGALHGIYEWLSLVELGIGENHAIAVSRTILVTLSFLFLTEFGRLGMVRTGGPAPGRWALLPLTGLAVAGGYYGLDGMAVSVKYTLGLCGGLYSAYLLARTYERGRSRENVWLAASAAILGMYSLSSVFAVPYAPFPPASRFNAEYFQGVFGFPVQLVRGVLAFGMAVSFTVYHGVSVRSGQGEKDWFSGRVYNLRPLAAVLVITAAGWLLTDLVGRRDMVEFGELQKGWARTLAASLEPDVVAALPLLDGAPDAGAYPHLREHLKQIRRDNPDFRSIAVRTVREGSFVLLADGKTDGAGDHREYGYAIERRPRSELDGYSLGRPSIEFKGAGRSEGAIVMAPIRSPAGDIVAQLSLELDTKAAGRMAGEDRLSIIALTGVLCLLSLAVTVAFFRTREAVEQASELRLAAAVSESEKRLREVTSALGEGVLLLDEAGAVRFMNPEAERLLGWREEELAGTDGHDMLHHHKLDGTAALRSECPSIRVLETGVRVSTEDEMFTRKDGSTFPVSYVSAPVVRGGRVAGVVVAFRDITARKRAELALRKSEHSYRTLSENLPGTVYRITLGDKGSMQFFNDMVLPMTGYSASELTRERICSFESHILEKDLPKVLNAVNISMMDGSAFQVEYRFRHKDGTVRHFLERGRTILGDDGRPSHIDGVVLDITERKRAEGELEKFRFIVEGSGEEFYLVGPDGRFEYANSTACRSLGYSLEELKGMRISDVDPDMAGRAFDAHLERLRSGELPPFETEHVARDGIRTPKEVKASLLVIDGRVYVCGIASDITGRKQLERQKADFFSMVTHDLKSPLTVIVAYADIILDEYLDKIPREVQDACKAIRSSCDNLQFLVEDYLTLSRIEAGALKAPLAAVDIVELVSEAGVMAGALASGKGLDVRIETCDEAMRARADRSHLNRALTNLVQNAVNYTPGGGSITIGCHPHEAEGTRYAAIWVEDTGPGIPAGERVRIFEKYYRSPKTQGIKGSGLGLAIVKAVAEAHSGSVVIEDGKGGGSRFTLLIPLT